MRVTVKGHYAVKVMLDLAIHQVSGPVRRQEISTRQAISLHCLEQLFRKLRTGKLVTSCRGPGGGYILSTSPDKVSIKDILDSVGENINPARDIMPFPDFRLSSEQNQDNGLLIVDTKEFRKTKNFFNDLGNMMTDYLSKTTLNDLAVREVG